MEFLKRLTIGIEEIILALLILIEVFDFFALLPPAWEYGEKILSILAVCYLFYEASLTKVIFGEREKNYDIMIIFAYLLLSFKVIIGFVITAVREESLVQGIYELVLKNTMVIEKTGFYLGATILIITSYFLLYEKVKRPSIMSIIHEERLPKNIWQKMTRFTSTYLILLAIYLLLFNFVFEWLAMTIDAAILVIILVLMLFIIAKRGRGMETESFLKKVSDASEEFYEKIISLFHSRKTVTIAITGLLALHLLVEIGNFIIPYTTGLFYSWYLEQLGPGHAPLSALMIKDMIAAGNVGGWILVFAAYALNVLAIVLLFFGPAYAWYFMYKKKRIRLPNILWLLFGSLAVFLLAPVIKIKQVATERMVGADIVTQQLPNIARLPLVLIVGLLVMGIFYILARKSLRRTTQVAFFAVFAYFGYYIYAFFSSVAKDYIMAVNVMTQGKEYFIAIHLLIFFAFTIIFYVGGYLIFLYEAYIKQKI
jgi:uncharacterized membrane protein